MSLFLKEERVAKPSLCMTYEPIIHCRPATAGVAMESIINVTLKTVVEFIVTPTLQLLTNLHVLYVGP